MSYRLRIIETSVRRLSLLLAFSYLLISCAPVLALSSEQRNVFDAGIPYFNVEEDSSSGGFCGAVLPGSNNAEKVWNFLIGEGLSPEQAAGVMGNLQAESGFDPFNQENGQPWPTDGWGLAQWTAGRRHAIRDAVIAELGEKYYVPTEEAGSMIGTADEDRLLTFQLEYLVQESNNRTVRPQSHPHITQPPSGTNEWEGLKTMQSVDDATYYWEWNYERPGRPHTEARLQFARDILAQYGSGTTGGAGGVTGGCVSGGLEGVTCPANMEAHPSRTGYFKMPDAPNGEYTIYASEARRYGSQQLVCVIYSVAIAFNDAMQGRSKLRIGDLNAGAPHSSHNRGVAVDLSGAGELQVASHIRPWKGTYDKEATILLGKMFADTGVLRNIWWCDPGDDSTEQILAYAQTKGLEGQIKCISGHADHFHVDIKAEYRLEEWTP